MDVIKAKKVVCINTLIDTIIADNAEEMYLDRNNFLKKIFAENLKKLEIYDCDYVEQMEIAQDTKIHGISRTMETIFKLRR